MSLFARLSELPDDHPDQRGDFDKRYLLTYMVNNIGKTPEIVLYRNREDWKCILNKLDGDRLYIDGRKDCDIQPFMPKPGYYNSDLNLLYIYKTPNRQWKRSFCSGIYKIINNIGTEKERWHIFAQAILEAKYLELDHIVSPLMSKYAITRHFAINEDCILHYKKHPIALLNFNHMEIQLIEPELKQELMDFFKYNRITKWKLNPTMPE